MKGRLPRPELVGLSPVLAAHRHVTRGQPGLTRSAGQRRTPFFLASFERQPARRAIEPDGAYAEAHYNPGRLLYARGDRVAAVASYRNALRQKPTLRPASHGAARLSVDSTISYWN